MVLHVVPPHLCVIRLPLFRMPVQKVKLLFVKQVLLLGLRIIHHAVVDFKYHVDQQEEQEPRDDGEQGVFLMLRRYQEDVVHKVGASGGDGEDRDGILERDVPSVHALCIMSRDNGKEVHEHQRDDRPRRLQLPPVHPDQSEGYVGGDLHEHPHGAYQR